MNSASITPAGVILAAGASSRMGRVKALLEIDGETFIDRVARVLGTKCNPVIAVLGHHAEAIRAGLRNPGAIQFAENPEPDCGMLTSLQIGLCSAPDLSAGVLFTPVDVPLVSLSTVSLLAAALSKGASVAVPVYKGKRGHPVAISGGVAERLMGLPESGRANDMIRAEVAVEITVADAGVILEVDTPQDYEALLCHVG
ncbi:MAG: nucleotidyltransferase family protein [Bryobacteraceae bacterium]